MHCGIIPNKTIRVSRTALPSYDFVGEAPTVASLFHGYKKISEKDAVEKKNKVIDYFHKEKDRRKFYGIGIRHILDDKLASWTLNKENVMFDIQTKSNSNFVLYVFTTKLNKETMEHEMLYCFRIAIYKAITSVPATKGGKNAVVGSRKNKIFDMQWKNNHGVCFTMRGTHKNTFSLFFVSINNSFLKSSEFIMTKVGRNKSIKTDINNVLLKCEKTNIISKLKKKIRKITKGDALEKIKILDEIEKSAREQKETYDISRNEMKLKIEELTKENKKLKENYEIELQKNNEKCGS